MENLQDPSSRAAFTNIKTLFSIVNHSEISEFIKSAAIEQDKILSDLSDKESASFQGQVKEQRISQAIENKSDDLPHVLMRKGYLEKQGNRIKTWKVRYFHLYMRPKQFMYFEDSEAIRSPESKGKKKKLSQSSSNVDSARSFMSISARSSSEILPEYHRHLVVDPKINVGSSAIKIISLEEPGIKIAKTDAFGFEIKTKARDWQFRATSKDNLEQWLAAFEFVISGECDKFIPQVEAAEKLIVSLGIVLDMNQMGSDAVKRLSTQNADFVTSKLKALKNLSTFFNNYSSTEDLTPIRIDTCNAINRMHFACLALLARSDIHYAISEFEFYLAMIRKLSQVKGSRVKAAAEEIWNLAVKKGKSILQDAKFENFIEGCSRDDCRYIDDRENFELKFEGYQKEIASIIKNLS
jgi:hypothetical protein